jgi:hypothetical protein
MSLHDELMSLHSEWGMTSSDDDDYQYWDRLGDILTRHPEGDHIMSAVDSIVRAWKDAGPGRDIHWRELERLRRKWPTLAKAIEELVQEKEEYTP